MSYIHVALHDSAGSSSEKFSCVTVGDGGAMSGSDVVGGGGK